MVEEGNHGGGEAEGGLDGFGVDAGGAGHGSEAGGGAIEADVLGHYPHIEAAEAADTAVLRLLGWIVLWRCALRRMPCRGIAGGRTFRPAVRRTFRSWPALEFGLVGTKEDDGVGEDEAVLNLNDGSDVHIGHFL